METGDDKLINGYLLGELSNEEQSRVEDRLFGDNLFFWKIDAARNELIEDYLQGSLSAQQQQKFEAYYLATPARRQRVESARLLSQAIANISPPITEQRPQPAPLPRHNRKMKWLLAAAVLIVALVGSWLVVETLRLRNQLGQIEAERAALRQREESLQLQAEREQAAREQTSEQLRREQEERARLEQELATLRGVQPSEQAAPVIALLSLSPVAVRDPGGMPGVVIGSRTGRVQVRLTFDGPAYANNRVTLQTAEGAPVWEKAGLKAAGQTVPFDLPANLLTDADYVLTLSGVPLQGPPEEIGKYSFRVKRK